MNPSSIFNLINNVRNYATSLFSDVVTTFEDTVLSTAEHTFKVLVFFIEFFVPVLNRFIHRLLLEELIEYSKSVGYEIVGNIEYNFGNMNSLSFLYFLFGFIFVIFSLKLIVKLVAALK